MSLIEMRGGHEDVRVCLEAVTPIENWTSPWSMASSFVLMGLRQRQDDAGCNMLAASTVDEWTVHIAGEESRRCRPGKLARWRTRAVGYCSSSTNLIPVLSAFENVEVPLLLLRLSRAERGRKVRTALAAVG